MNQTHDSLIELLRQADPAPSREPANLASREAVRRRAIAQLEGRARSGPTDGLRIRREPVRHRLAVGIGGGVLAAIVVGIGLVIFGGGSVGPTSPAFAQAAIRIAEANPRLLVGEPGWAVTGADEFDLDQGSITFEKADEELDVYWSPERDYPNPDVHELRQQAQGPRGSRGNPITPGGGPPIVERYANVSALGQQAVLAYDANGRSYRLIFPPQNGTWVQIIGSARDLEMTRERFLNIVGTLYAADVESWLAALPERIVRPVDHAAQVDQMLDGLPIPDSVDVEELRSEDLAMDRYHLGARVTGAVACGWLDQWAAAVGSGDKTSADQAVEAMATSHDWPILREMADEGGFSQVVWEYSREMAADNRGALLGVAGTETDSDGNVYELSPSYASGLGCDSEQRILRADG